MPYDHDDEFDWDSFEFPTKPSPSGIFRLNKFGAALLKRISPKTNESALDWLTKVAASVPQISYGAPVPKAFREGLQLQFQGQLPSLLLELWRYAPGLNLGSGTIFFDPGRFLQENQYQAAHVPEILTTMVFFGGDDGFNGAVSLGGDDPKAYEWSHEEGFTGLAAETMMHYLAERIAWYATTFDPFCYQQGYVIHP